MKTTTRKIRKAPTAQIIDFIVALKRKRKKAERLQNNPSIRVENILRRARELATQKEAEKIRMNYTNGFKY